MNQVSILVKHNEEVRSGAEITDKLFQNLGLGDKVKNAILKATNYQSYIAAIAGAVSWVLLAFAEPKLGIAITNHLELKKLEEEKAIRPKTPSTRSLHLSTNSPFLAFQFNEPQAS
jgi:hypothetical protein